MSNSNGPTQFQRSIRDVRLAFSNLLYLFTPGSKIVFTSYEILSGLSILFLLVFLSYIAAHFAY